MVGSGPYGKRHRVGGPMEDGDGVFEGGPKQPSMEYKSTHAGHSPSIVDVVIIVYLCGEVTMGRGIYGVCLRKFSFDRFGLN